MGFLGRGSYGCIYSPPVPCDKKDDAFILDINSKNKHKGRKVSKIFAKEDAFQKELNASLLAAEVDPSGKLLLIPNKACAVDVDKFQKRKDAKRCKNLYGDPPVDNVKLPSTLYQLTMPYGGTRIDHVLKDRALHGKSVTVDEFLKMIEPAM